MQPARTGRLEPLIASVLEEFAAAHFLQNMHSTRELTFIRESSREATRSLSSLTLARMPVSFLLAPSRRLLASASAARLGATTCGTTPTNQQSCNACNIVEIVKPAVGATVQPRLLHAVHGSWLFQSALSVRCICMIAQSACSFTAC